MVDALRFIRDYKTGSAKVGRRVLVVGAGNTAIDAATASVRLGASEVSILYRRSESEMPAFRYEFDLAKQDGIAFHWLTLPVAIHGENAVESVECVRMELGPPDSSGRRFPQPVAGSNFRLAADMVITSLGQSRLIGFLEKCRGVELRNQCVAVKRETGQTSNPKYFAGGDCVSGGREVVDAVADGKRAATGNSCELGVTLAAHHAAILQPIRSAQHDADCFAVDAALLFQNARGERFHCVVIEHRHGRLNNDGTSVKILIHEVNRASRDLDTVLESLVLRHRALEKPAAAMGWIFRMRFGKALTKWELSRRMKPARQTSSTSCFRELLH